MKQYNKLYKKLINKTITPTEHKTLLKIAFGSPFLDSNNKGSKEYYSNTIY